MSYGGILSTIFGKRPVWLYHFIKDGEERFYTSRNSDYTQSDADFFDQLDMFADDAINFFGRTWISTPIMQSRIRTTSAMGRAETELVMPQTNEWAQRYITDNGYEDNTVLIYHLFENDPDLELSLRFRGRVIAARPMLTRIVLVCENRFTELRRKGLAAVIQRPCRHALYHGQNGRGCGAVLANFQTPGTITAYTGNNYTVAAAASQADGYYSGGILSWQGKLQFITRHSGSTLTLLGPVPGLAEAFASSSSEDVLIAPGCDLSRATCDTRFGQLANFGGFPWADESPYDGRTLF